MKPDPAPRIVALPDLLARANAAPVFNSGPFSRALSWLPGGRSPNRGLEHQAIALAAIAWVPLFLEALGRDGFRFGVATASLVVDFGVHARYLVALPLLVLADRFCGGRLTAIAYGFQDMGMVGAAERTRFDALVASARRRCASRLAATLILIATYGLVGALLAWIPTVEIPEWHHLSGPRSPSAAGWWHLLVSAPLLIALMLAWLWRLLVWAWFLSRIAHLPIRLCAAHPDRAAGLKFVGLSVRGFAPIGAAIGALLAGRIANHVWNGVKLATYDTTMAAVVVGVLLVFGAPLLAFTSRLMREWREGAYHYGKLAAQVGQQFEDKWFRPGSRVDTEALHASDFSAAVDLSGYASNVYAMRLVPADIKSFTALAIATLLPLLPVVVIAAPFDVLLKSIAALLF